jgi:hypothetical protein
MYLGFPYVFSKGPGIISLSSINWFFFLMESHYMYIFCEVRSKIIYLYAQQYNVK